MIEPDDGESNKTRDDEGLLLSDVRIPLRHLEPSDMISTKDTPKNEYVGMHRLQS